MTSTRRQMLQNTAAAAAGIALAGHGAAQAAESSPARLKIGMCDWSIGRYDPSVFKLAREIGLDGIEVSIGKEPGDLYLRKPDMQQAYLDAAKEAGVAIPSMAMGILNHVALMSEPRAAVWTADTIDVARKLGARCILLAFFHKGELKEENAEDMRRTTELLAELAPRAEKAGVILGIESYLSAEGHLKILDAVKSPAVQVYYDVYNSHVTKGHDPVREIKLLGSKRICQVHLKEGGQRLGESGKIDWASVAATLKEIDYRGWLVLETSNPSGDVVKDTTANLAYARKTFAALAG